MNNEWRNLCNLIIPIIIGIISCYYYSDLFDLDKNKKAVEVVSIVFSILIGVMMKSIDWFNSFAEFKPEDTLTTSELYSRECEYRERLAQRIGLLYVYFIVIFLSLAQVFLHDIIIEDYYIYKINLFFIVVTFYFSCFIPISEFNMQIKKRDKEYKKARQKKSDFEISGLS